MKVPKNLYSSVPYTNHDISKQRVQVRINLMHQFIGSNIYQKKLLPSDTGLTKYLTQKKEICYDALTSLHPLKQQPPKNKSWTTSDDLNWHCIGTNQYTTSNDVKQPFFTMAYRKNSYMFRYIEQKKKYSPR